MAINREDVGINTTELEINLRLYTGIFLAFISMILTVSLFLSLAGNNLIRQIIMVSLALGLEASKILTFRMRKGYRAISICLIVVSVIASFGSALLVVDNNKANINRIVQAEDSNFYQYKTSVAEIHSIDVQIDTLINRINNLPSDFITASKEITTEIDSLRAERQATLKGITLVQPDTSVSSEAPVSMFMLFTRITTINEDFIVLSLLMFMAVLLEVSILSLTRQYPIAVQMEKELPNSRSELSYNNGVENRDRIPIKVDSEIIPQTFIETPPTPSHIHIEQDFASQEFLSAMYDPTTYPILRGRDATAQILGVPPYKAKIIVQRLIQEGKIKVEGKRLVMCGNVPLMDSVFPTKEETTVKMNS
jgi:hypothetical protein